MNNTREDNMSSHVSLHVPAGDSSHHRGGKVGWLSWAAIAFGALLLTYLIVHHLTAAHDGGHDDHAYEMPPLWACSPFVAILLSIAILPLIPATSHWWESNQNRLCLALIFGTLTLAYYMFHGGSQRVIRVLDHAIIAEYIPFIILLFSLYVISGGISLRGDLVAKPATNAAFLAVGGALASFIGTTGAAMLLIRPLLQTNSERRHVTHTVIFFIFLVCNVGGCLLPIGDPPLFLGYLMGVPFLWTFGLFAPWLVTCAVILVIYWVWDTIAYRQEKKKDIFLDETRKTPLRLSGKINLLWLVGVVFAVALIDPNKQILGYTPFPFMRELVMLAFVGLSLKSTPPTIRLANKFNYHAILEVAALFLGIFICMQAPIEILNQKGSELGLTRPWQFFWATGSLSSFLDNAPTYVVFFSTAQSITDSAGPATGPGILTLVGGGHIMENLLVGISLGAVFMGAMTYIGNGPNFMVKSIAEQAGVRMPSFFGYMLYSVCILVPLFVVVTIIFV
ncbi:MAG: sodium:proton antiporter [Phycisphaerales bacterium]|nr:MAG: sodium:proton antiporter [Phycisphaerales bacterium]